MTTTVTPPVVVESEGQTAVSPTDSARVQRNTGSFATRLLQKALDDRKKTDPELKIPSVTGSGTQG